MTLGCSSKAFVAGYQYGSEAFRESDVGRVVAGEVVAKPEDASQETLMPMPSQREIHVVQQRLLGPLLGQCSAQEQATKRRGDLHVTKSGNV